MLASLRRHSTSSEAVPAFLRRGLPIKKPIPNVKKVLMVASCKGGVGKSTVAVNLAVAMSRIGRQVGLLDADISGPSIPKMMNIKGSMHFTEQSDKPLAIPKMNYGVKCMSLGLFMEDGAPAAVRGPIITKTIDQFLFQVDWGHLDVLVVDMPPGTGDTYLSISQLTPIHGAVIVTTPQDVALTDVERGIQMLKKINIPIHALVNNMSHFECQHCHHTTDIFPKSTAMDALLRDRSLGEPVNIPLDHSIAMSGDQGTPITISNPECIISQRYHDLAHRLNELLSG